MEAARFLLSLIWLQEPVTISSGNSRLLMIFVGMVAIAMVAQAIVIIVAALGAMKFRNRVFGIVEELRVKVMPVIDSTQSMVHELHPKIRTITDNLVETSHVVRAKAQEFDSTISDVNQKARVQAARVDEMVTSVLDTTAGIASTAQNAVKVPVREFSGLIAGLKAGIDVLVGRGKRSTNYSDRKVPEYQDESIGY
jgi:methyl-accepting chemotaxis protein